MSREAWERAVEAMRAKRRELIAQPLDRIYGDLLRAGFEHLAAGMFQSIELYGDENIRMANDTIMVDPLLGRARKGTVGRPLTKLEEAISEDCQISGAIHSAKFHAANEIAILLRARIERMKEQS